MKRTKVILSASLLPILLFGADAPPGPAISHTWTNQVQRVVQIVSSTAVPGKCPECGAPNHHNIEVQIMSGYGLVTTEVIYNGKTNAMVVGDTPTTNWIATNVVYAFNRQQPGWSSPPPLPASTNR